MRHLDSKLAIASESRHLFTSTERTFITPIGLEWASARPIATYTYILRGLFHLQNNNFQHLLVTVDEALPVSVAPRL